MRGTEEVEWDDDDDVRRSDFGVREDERVKYKKREKGKRGGKIDKNYIFL